MIDRDIAARVAAYRGNPQALMQEYQQSQSLIDLLALQKIKSEKEAAIRDMQLKMARSGKPPTIADQREQEVMSMTKDELLNQQSGLLEQQQQAQQSAIQELAAAKNPAAGVPTLPTPNVMPEQAMAAGGIVAFKEGGAEWDKVNRDYARDKPYREAESLRYLKEELRDAQQRLEAGDPRAAEDIEALRREIRSKQPKTGANKSGIGSLIPEAQAATLPPGVAAVPMTDAEIADIKAKQAAAIAASAPVQDEAIYDPMTGVKISGPDPKPATRVIKPGEKYEPNLLRDILQGRPQTAPPPAAPAPAAPAPAPADNQQADIEKILTQVNQEAAAPTSNAPQGIASVVPHEFQDLTTAYTKSAAQGLDVDPEKEARDRQNEYNLAVGLPMEAQITAARGRLDESQKRQAEIEKAQRRRAFFDSLAGASGATFQQTLGGVSRSLSAAQTRAEQAELQRIKERDAALQNLGEAGVKLGGERFALGQSIRKEARDRQDKARTEAGLGVGRALSAQTSRDIADAQREANVIQNEQLRQSRVETLRGQTLRGSIELKSLFAQREQLSGMAAMGVKLTPAQQQELTAIDKKIQLTTDEINSRFDDMLTSRNAPVPKGGTDAFKVERIQ